MPTVIETVRRNVGMRFPSKRNVCTQRTDNNENYNTSLDNYHARRNEKYNAVQRRKIL